MTSSADVGHAIVPRIVAFDGGAMMIDGGLPRPPSPDWFERAWWQAQHRLEARGGGRGGIAFLDTPVGRCVLRHYHRGGWMAPLLGDRYLWRGRDRSRGFLEFGLLAELCRRGLPVPEPIGARHRRRGLYYTADLITRAVSDAQTLAEIIGHGRFDAALAERIGALVARFHEAGLDHADLNAHNILVAGRQIWLIDLDRGEIRVSGTAWKLANLARLKRSLLKVGASGRDEAALDRDIWTPFMRGYQRGFGTGG